MGIRQQIQKGLHAYGYEFRRFRAAAIKSKFSNFNEQELIAKYLTQYPPKHRFCIDIGAGDGEKTSNSCALFHEGWAGLALEWDGEKFSRLAYKYAIYPSVRLSRSRVTPQNVQALLQSAEVPQNFGFLSLDIDSYDYFVLEKILEQYQPSLLCIEINEKIPPPIKFSVQWDENFRWTGDHFYGHSLAMLEMLALRFDYVIVGLEYNNAFLLPQKIFQGTKRSLTEIYVEGYLQKPDRLQRLPWNKDMEDLQNLNPEQVVEAIHNRFAKYAGKYFCEI